MKFSTTLLFGALAGAALCLSGVSAAEQVEARSVEGTTVDLETRAVSGAARLTYYYGSQLKNPACGGRTPTDNDMIAAVSPHGSSGKCGDKITIQHGSRKVTVKIVDYCASCPPKAFDLSKGAFKKLASLEQGVINGARYWKSG